LAPGAAAGCGRPGGEGAGAAFGFACGAERLGAACGLAVSGADEACAAAVVWAPDAPSPAAFVAVPSARRAAASSTVDAAALTSIPAAVSFASSSLLLIPCSLAIS